MNIEALLKRLTSGLDNRALNHANLELAYKATRPLQFLAPSVVEATKGRLQPLSIPWGRLAIDVIEQRCTITGFRVGEDAENDLWRIWQDNDLDEGSQIANQDSLIYGSSCLLVWADDFGDPLITVESATQCLVLVDPATRRRIAGVKRWIDFEGFGRLTLLLPGVIYRYKSQGKIAQDQYGNGDVTSVNWQPDGSVPNPLGVVPLIPLPNRPTVRHPQGTSELADLLPTLAALDKLHSDLMVASEFHAMPRRWSTGFDLPEKRDPITGLPTGEVDSNEAFNQSQERVWLSENPETKFGEFPGASLQGMINAIEHMTKTLAALASLPPHMVGITSANPASADAIRSAESGLVMKAKRKMQAWSGGYEEAMRIAQAIKVGRFDARLNELETVWASAETPTLAAKADAMIKLVQGGILPPDAALEVLDYSPSAIGRIQDMRRHSALTDTARALMANLA